MFSLARTLPSRWADVLVKPETVIGWTHGIPPLLAPAFPDAERPTEDHRLSPCFDSATGGRESGLGPHGSRFELLVLRSEIEFVHSARQVFRHRVKKSKATITAP